MQVTGQFGSWGEWIRIWFSMGEEDWSYLHRYNTLLVCVAVQKHEGVGRETVLALYGVAWGCVFPQSMAGGAC